MAASKVQMPTNQNATTFQSIGALHTAPDLIKKFHQLKDARIRREMRWKLNLAFYRGEQYAFINRVTRQLMSLPIDEGDLPRHRVRLVSNLIMPGVQSLIAKQTKTKPRMYCTPGSGDDASVKSAQMGEALLEYWWDEFKLLNKLQEVLTWANVCAQGYWWVTWDPQAGKQMQFLMGPDGQPIVDESLKTLYRQNMEDMMPGMADLFTKTIMMGDICVKTVSPFNLYIDPAAESFDDARYVILQQPMDPDEIKARWNVNVPPDATPQVMDTSYMNGGVRIEPVRNMRNVYFGYFLPNPVLPKGRVVAWIEDPDEILEDNPWPYPVNTLPFFKFPGINVPGDPYDSSVVEQALPIQKEYNKSLSQLIEYKNLTLKPQVFAPLGSLRTRLTNEPGAIFEYAPIGGLKPEPIPVPAIPPYVFEHLATIKARADDIFSLTEVTQGTVPPNVEAAQAIDLLQEMATDRIAPQIMMMEDTLARAAEFMLVLAQKYYIEPRLLKIKGSGGSIQVKQFSRADLIGNISVHTEAGSGMPRTRAGRQALIMDLVKQGILPPDRAAKYFDLGDLKSLQQQLAADEDQALREHDKLIQGQCLNPVAYQQAMEQLQETNFQINPQTQQPFDGPEDIQEFIRLQCLQPTTFEDWKTHLDVHSTFMKSLEFEMLPTQVQQSFVDHFNATRQALFNIPRLPDKIEAPRTSLSIHATAGPSAIAQILERQGVLEVTPEMLQEPPLETYVRDDAGMDQNFVASNDPVSMAKMQMEMEQLQQQTAAGGQQAMIQQSQGLQKLQQNQEKHAQDMVHAQQAHESKLNQQAQMHAVKVKQARQPKPRNPNGSKANKK